MYYRICINDNLELDTLQIQNYQYNTWIGKNTKKRDELTSHIKELIEVNIMEGRTNFKQEFLIKFMEMNDYRIPFFTRITDIWRYVSNLEERIHNL